MGKVRVLFAVIWFAEFSPLALSVETTSVSDDPHEAASLTDRSTVVTLPTGTLSTTPKVFAPRALFSYMKSDEEWAQWKAWFANENHYQPMPEGLRASFLSTPAMLAPLREYALSAEGPSGEQAQIKMSVLNTALEETQVLITKADSDSFELSNIDWVNSTNELTARFCPKKCPSFQKLFHVSAAWRMLDALDKYLRARREWEDPRPKTPGEREQLGRALGEAAEAWLRYSYYFEELPESEARAELAKAVAEILPAVPEKDRDWFRTLTTTPHHVVFARDISDLLPETEVKVISATRDKGWTSPHGRSRGRPVESVNLPALMGAGKTGYIVCEGGKDAEGILSEDCKYLKEQGISFRVVQTHEEMVEAAHSLKREGVENVAIDGHGSSVGIRVGPSAILDERSVFEVAPAFSGFKRVVFMSCELGRCTPLVEGFPVLSGTPSIFNNEVSWGKLNSRGGWLVSQDSDWVIASPTGGPSIIPPEEKRKNSWWRFPVLISGVGY